MKYLLTLSLFISIQAFAQGVWEYDTTWVHEYSYTKIYIHSETGKDRYCTYYRDKLVECTGMNDIGDDIDSCLYYHQNGNLAAIYNFETEDTYDFHIYDTLGRVYFEGECYKGIRVGQWNEYDVDGNVRAFVKYKHSANDPKLTEDSLAQLKVEKYALSDTMLYDSEYGFDHPSFGRSRAEIHESWGIIAGMKKVEFLEAITPFQYYSDGVIGWMPSNCPVMPALYLRDILPNGWDLSLYMLESYNHTIEAPEVILELYNENIPKGKYIVNFWWAMYNKEDKEKAIAYFDSLNYTKYELGMKIEEDLGVYHTETKSFFMVFYFNLKNNKFKKAVQEYLPEHIALLESWADQF